MTWPATKTNTATRLLVWVLAVSILLLPGVSVQKRYHCQITGATSSTCCCKEGAASGPEASPCAKRTCCSSESEWSDPDGIAKDADCDCCDVTYERTAHDVTQVDPQSKSDSQGSGGYKVALQGPRAFGDAVLDRTATWRPPDGAHRAGSGPPVYLLHCVFLI